MLKTDQLDEFAYRSKSDRNHFDVMIIGGGPAGLFAARELLMKNDALNIAIFDSGKLLSKRYCSLIESGKCAKCDVCDIVHGVGGAGMYSDGKLSLYPAGSQLKHLVDDDLKQINEYVLNILLKDLGGDQIHKTVALQDGDNRIVDQLKVSGFDYKEYNVFHVGTDGIRESCERLENDLISMGLYIKTKHNLIDINKFDKIFVGAFQNGNKIHYYSANTIVFATGKASGLMLRKFLRTLGVTHSYNHIEIGVRIECARDAVQALSKAHLDAKIKFKFDDFEARTFCLCDGGFMTKCFYDKYSANGKICTISGFSYHQKKSQNSNFSLLVRNRFPNHIDPIKTQLGIIETINAASSDGTLVVQRLGDFRNNVSTSFDALKRNSIQSTIKYSTPINLRWVLPGYVTTAIEIFINKMENVCPELVSDDTLLNAPVWEFCWDRIATDNNFCTNIPGLYVIGDATGWARGIVQAASMGVIASKTIIKAFGD